LVYKERITGKNCPFTTEELALSNAYQLAALTRLLNKKGIAITSEEIADEVRQIQVEQQEKRMEN